MSHLNQEKENKYLDHEVVELFLAWILAHDIVEQDTEQVREDHDLQIDSQSPPGQDRLNG
jgi:hypothetical protein